MIQIIRVDGAIRRRHEPVSDSESGEVDLDLCRRVLVVDLLGDGRHKLSGVRLAEREEFVGLVSSML